MNEHKTDLEILKKLEEKLRIKFELTDIENFNDIEISLTPKSYYFVENENITAIKIHDINLKTIPKEITKLKNLKVLDLTFNKITEIPKEIAELKNLKVLYLSNNQITEIPKEIAELKNLERLDLSYNKINKINKVLLELNNKILKKLKNCVLFIEDASVMKINLWEKAENTFSDRGKLIVSVPSRTKCQIKKIKLNRYFVETDYGAGWVLSSIVKNKNWLDLSNNPIIKSNLDEIKKLDIQELLLYLLKIQEGSNKPLNEVKILVVGDERVGKTSLINRIIPENSYNRNQESTKGIDIQQHKLKNGIKANIWDFAGQEITHQTHKFFLSTRSLYLLVIDAQKEDNDSGIYDWLETIKSYSNNSPVIIAVNKIDTKDNYKEFDEFRYKRNFNIVDILYTSAEKETNIDKLIDSINKNTENIKDVKKEFPKEWFKIKEELEIFSESNKNYIKDHIEKSKFENICETYNVKDEAEQNTLLKILNEIGTVVSYKKSDHIVIINPMWITNAVYKVIRSELIKDGVLTNQDLDNLFKNDDKYKKRHYKWIMDLLNQFELSFQIEKNKILIPAKLSLNQPALNLEKYQEGLNFRYKYESKLKKNIISHFIVKINRYIDNTQKIKYWRRGVFLEYKNNKTIVISEEEKNIITIAIEINNKQGKEFLTIIREYFKEINENLKVIEEVPLILNNKIVGYKSYKYLENLENQNIKKQYFEIQINGEDNIHEFDISELLNGYKYESSREGGNMGNKILVKGDYHENKTIINQTHNGHGDNVAGNKIINNKLEEFTKLFEEFKEELKKSDKLEENSELLNNIELYVKDGKKNKMLLNILTGALGGLSASGISLLAPQIGELLTKLF